MNFFFGFSVGTVTTAGEEVEDASTALLEDWNETEEEEEEEEEEEASPLLFLELLLLLLPLPLCAGLLEWEDADGEEPLVCDAAES